MAAANTNAQIAPPGGLRFALMAIAAFVLTGAIMDFPIAFHDFGHTEPLLVFAQRVTSVKLMLAPLIAGAALYLAVTGRPRGTIAMLAALILMNWLSDLPTFPIHGFPSFSVPGAMIIIERLVFPLLAVAAIVLALRDTRLGMAAIIVALPMLLTAINASLYMSGMMIHGF